MHTCRCGKRRPNTRGEAKGLQLSELLAGDTGLGGASRRKPAETWAQWCFIVPVSMNRWCQLRASESRCGVCLPQAPRSARAV